MRRPKRANVDLKMKCFYQAASRWLSLSDLVTNQSSADFCLIYNGFNRALNDIKFGVIAAIHREF